MNAKTHKKWFVENGKFDERIEIYEQKRKYNELDRPETPLLPLKKMN